MQLVPVVHWAALHSNEPEQINFFLPRVGCAYGLIGLGFVFYASRIPERWRPGPSTRAVPLNLLYLFLYKI